MPAVCQPPPQTRKRSPGGRTTVNTYGLPSGPFNPFTKWKLSSQFPTPHNGNCCCNGSGLLSIFVVLLNGLYALGAISLRKSQFPPASTKTRRFIFPPSRSQLNVSPKKGTEKGNGKSTLS